MTTGNDVAGSRETVMERIALHTRLGSVWQLP